MKAANWLHPSKAEIETTMVTTYWLTHNTMYRLDYGYEIEKDNIHALYSPYPLVLVGTLFVCVRERGGRERERERMTGHYNNYYICTIAKIIPK